MSEFEEIFGGITQGAGDVLRAGVADVSNTYQQVLTGKPAPMSAPTGDMVYTSTASEPPPQSFEAALRTHFTLAEAEAQAGQAPQPQAEPAPEAAPSASPAPAPAMSGPEPEL